MVYMTFQGDVDLREIKEIPKSAKLLDIKTIMYGEATGHHHTFNGQVLVYEPTENETMTVRGEPIKVQKYVQVNQKAELVHQEHQKQEIPQIKIAVLQEREWDVLDQQIRQVMD